MKKISRSDKRELKEFLDEKYDLYNRTSFIETDPISIPHQFSKKEDIEISGFLTATIAWGRRASIISNANKLMRLMGDEPYEFVINHSPKDLKKLAAFVHRTFNAIDCIYFIKSLRNIYENHGGLERSFDLSIASLPGKDPSCEKAQQAISNFRTIFFELKYPERTKKHVSDPMSGSSAKRINMYLRWMIRNDKRGVDFGIWKPISTTAQRGAGLIMPDLCCPLDVHTGNIARKLGLLKRTQNDWRAVEELTLQLREMDPKDPVKYDFALFGLGAFENF